MVEATTRPRLRRRDGSMVGLVALAAIVVLLLAALFADVLAPHDPLTHDLDSRLQPPGAGFPMGTDGFGRDVSSRLLHGARASLLVGLVSVGVATVLGATLGTVSAYIGGRADLLGQRLADVSLSFPALVVVLLLVAAFGPSAQIVVIGIVIAFTPQVARLARAECLRAKEEVFVDAARIAGADSWRVMTRHILPRNLPPVLVLATALVGEAIVLEAALSYLGLGVPPPQPSWGGMIFDGAHNYLETAPWLTIAPGLALTLTALSFSLLGDVLRDRLSSPPGRVRSERVQATHTSPVEGA